MWYSIVLAAYSAAVQVEVKTSDGPAVAGDLVEATAERIVVRPNERHRVAGGANPPFTSKRRPPDTISQPNGMGRIGRWRQAVGQKLQRAVGVGDLELATGGRVRVPTRDIRWVRLAPLPRTWRSPGKRPSSPTPPADRLAVIKAVARDRASGWRVSAM